MPEHVRSGRGQLRLGPGRQVEVKRAEIGRRAELAVVDYLVVRGFSILGRNESIGPTKRARLRKAVERLWRETLEAMKDVERVRIDAAAVTFEGGVTRVEYVEGAIG